VGGTPQGGPRDRRNGRKVFPCTQRGRGESWGGFLWGGGRVAGKKRGNMIVFTQRKGGGWWRGGKEGGGKEKRNRVSLGGKKKRESPTLLASAVCLPGPKHGFGPNEDFDAAKRRKVRGSLCRITKSYLPGVYLAFREVEKLGTSDFFWKRKRGRWGEMQQRPKKLEKEILWIGFGGGGALCLVWKEKELCRVGSGDRGGGTTISPRTRHGFTVWGQWRRDRRGFESKGGKPP